MNNKRYKSYLEEDSQSISSRTLRRLTSHSHNFNSQTFHDNSNNNRSQINQMESTVNLEQPNASDLFFDGSVDLQESQAYNMTTIEDTAFSIQDYLSDQSLDDIDSFSKSGKPKNLLEYIQNEDFFKKIDTPVDKTVGEIFLMILKFSVTNYLSMTATTNLFELVNSIFVDPILPNSRHLIDKVLNSDEDAEFHATCDNCSAYVGKFGTLENVRNCTKCEVELDLKNSSNTNFFLLINCSKQISSLLSIYEEHYNYVMNDRLNEEEYVKDIYDGIKYREFVNSLPESEKRSYVTLIFNTDGAPKFKSSNASIYPMYLMVNEIPIQSRLDNLVICGLWFNKEPPKLNILLTPFVSLMNNLTNSGIKCTIKGRELLVKPYVLSCCVDAVARAPIQGVKQFNGKFGCNWCLHPGEWAYGSNRYPFLEISAQDRDCQLTINDMFNATPDNPINGVKYPSPFINLTGFDVIWGFTPDYMHCCLEGVGKQITEYLLESLTYTDLKILDSNMNGITAPYQVSRFTRGITDRNNWKAREWENFILYYSVPLLSTKIEKKLLDYWLLFVISLHILLGDQIHMEDLNEAGNMLRKFVKKTESLFGIKAMTYNIHQLLHIHKNVQQWGPLWAQSTYSFESANYYLLRAIKCANAVPRQILRYVHNRQNVRILQEYVFRKASDTVRFYCEDILTQKLRNVTKIKNITYIGKGEEVDDRVAINLDSSVTVNFFKRIVKDECLYSSVCKKKSRSNNSFAQLKNGKIIKIVNFCVNNNNKEFTLCQLANTQTLFTNCTKIMKIIDIGEDIVSVMTNDIMKICVYMEIGNKKYVSAVPNLLHY